MLRWIAGSRVAFSLDALCYKRKPKGVVVPKSFFIIPEDVFRLGNAQGPRLGNVRARDVDTTSMNGILVVIANGKGVSVFDETGIAESPFEGWVWKLSAALQLPVGLQLVNDKPHHYCVAPTTNMPIDKYKGLLEELGLRAERFIKKAGKAVS